VNLALAKALDRVVGNAAARALGAADAAAALLRGPPPPIDRVSSVLVVKFWGLGNWALLRPVVSDLRASRPGARFVAVTLAGNVPLVSDLFDETHAVRADGWRRLATDLARALSRLRRDPPDLSLDFEQFSRAGAVLARLAGVPQRIGFSSGGGTRDRLYTALVPFRRDVHAARSFRDLAEAAGARPGPYEPGGLAPTPRGLAEALAAVGAPGRLVVLHPGSGDNFPGRRWSEAGFAAVGRRAAAAHGALVAVGGSAAEADLCERVARGCGGVSVAGRLSVEGWVGLLARATAVVSNDTGAVHLASALGRPVVALFGPNTPTLYAPLSRGSRSLSRRLPCSPCLTEENYRSSRCRLPTCMAAIATGEVATALDAAVEEGARRPPAPADPETTCATRAAR
jgi:ADP-heptose:LPS heptosyltransferase